MPRLVEEAAPPSAERIERFERIYGIDLPRSYRQVVERYGELRGVGVPYHLLGLSDDRRRRPTTATSLAALRAANPDFPSDLLPVELLPQGQVACIEVDGTPDPPVVLLDVEDEDLDRVPAAPTYSAFCLDWLSDVRGITTALAHTRGIDRQVAKGQRPRDKVARPDEWRAYRLCSQDVLVGVTVLRHNRDAGVTEVAALPTTSLTALAEDAPVRGLLTTVLSDAYRSGGDLSLRFVSGTSRSARPVRRPDRVERFARDKGIELGHPSHGEIGASAALRLFIESLTIPDGLRQLLHTDAVGIGPAAVCYAIASGTWDAVAAEHLARNSRHPFRVFRGTATPLETAAWFVDLGHAADAVLLSSLARRVAADGAGDPSHDVEDEARPVDVRFTDHGTVVVSTEGPLGLAWSLFDGDDTAQAIEVLPFAADIDTIADRLPRLAAWLAEVSGDAGPAILVPRDGERLLGRRHERVLDQVEDVGVDLLVAPLYATTICADAARRLEHARTSRQ